MLSGSRSLWDSTLHQLLSRLLALVVHFRRLPFLPLAAVAAAAFACGDGTEVLSKESKPAGALAELVPEGGAKVVFPGRTLTVDELVAAGYKKSRELSVETLPGATEAWYGFFNRKDIEVRVYESHDAALGLGREPAYAATKKQKRRGGGDRGAGHEGITGYNAYLIAGNLVMLCELDVASCEALVDGVK